MWEPYIQATRTRLVVHPQQNAISASNPAETLAQSPQSTHSPLTLCQSSYRVRLHMEPLYGILDLLVLRTLLFGPLHGYAIAAAIRNSSGDELKIEFGSLYPALKRIELKGWISAKWETSERNRRTRVYRLTPAGRKRLQQETTEWADFVRAVGRVLTRPPTEASS
jgi:PadR family transcriptional regulator PadR